MTRHQVTLRMRPLPWPVRLLRRIVGGKGGTQFHAVSNPRSDIWFSVLVPYAWRSAHRWYAERANYFWMRCPLCDRHFGGQECDYLSGMPQSVPDPLTPPDGPFGPAMSVMICPRCTRRGRGVRT